MDFTYLGCRIVHRRRDGASRFYRGIDRQVLSGDSGAYVSPPRPWTAPQSSKLARVEDVFEFIPDPAVAVRIYGDVQFVDPSYELIGCSAESRLVDYLSPPGSDHAISHFLVDPDEAVGVENVKRRLSTKPREPDWPILGYDIASFSDFLSIISGCIDIEGTAYADHRRHLNHARLFPSSEIASKILDEHRTLSDFDGREYFVFRILVPPSAAA